MNRNEYVTILTAVRAARDIVESVSNPGYPGSDFPGEALHNIFYRLNDFCIELSSLRDACEK